MHNWFRLGILIPLVTLVFLVAQIALSFVPIQYFTFRPWEAILYGRSEFFPVGAHKHLVYTHSYGDLSSLGNRPDIREYKLERLTTDALGFRNLEWFPFKPLDIIFFGDSFAEGASLDDTQTVEVQLAKLSGKRVYNAGAINPHLIVSSINMLPTTMNGLVVYEIVERNLCGSASLYTSHSQAKNYSASDWVMQVADRLHLTQFLEQSALKILAGKALKVIQNNVILPNPDQDNVLAIKLKNQQTMLFTPSDIVPSDAILVPGSTELVVDLAAKAKKKGLRFVVVIVPNKSTVYTQMLSQPTKIRFGCENIVHRFEYELRANHIEFIDLAGPFKVAAQEAFKNGKYIYWIDDTHWNAAGASVAAQEINRYLLGTVHS